MPWVDKTEHVMIRRRYHCDVCDFTFDMRHASAEEPMPDCPRCVELATQGVVARADSSKLDFRGSSVTWVPPLPSIGTTKGKAIDLAQKIAEEDYGLTDMNDNQRVGDIAFKPPAPMQTAEREAAIREMMQAGVPETLPLEHQQKADNYWQGNAGGSAEQTIATQEVSKAAAAEARRQGVDPVGILEAGRTTGNMPMRMNVMAAVDAKELPEALAQGQARTAATARGT